MIWNKVGFVLSSRQRTEVFILAKNCETIDEIEMEVRVTSFTGVKRILKDFEKEGLVKVKENRVELTKKGENVYQKILPIAKKLL
jgi:predicted transcriptional regulator